MLVVPTKHEKGGLPPKNPICPYSVFTNHTLGVEPQIQPLDIHSVYEVYSSKFVVY